MKQVVFAVLLMAMASLTGCLNGDDSPVDENIDTTSDNNDGLIDPVGVTGYTPPETANITVYSYNETSIQWVAKDGNRITTSCISTSESSGNNFVIYDSDDRIIYVGNSDHDYGANANGCENNNVAFDITLGPEPVKVGLTKGTLSYSLDYATVVGHYSWLVTF
jgi:hypothetical protein